MSKKDLKKVILDYLQENSLQLRKQFKLADAKLEENPTRLVVMSHDNLNLTELEYNNVKFPVEVKKVENSVVVLDNEAKTVNFGKTDFSDQEKKILNLSDAVNPNAVQENVKSKNKEQAFLAWKKRNKNVKIVE